MDGPVCPHCGNSDKIYELKGVRSKPSKKNPEGIQRHGLKKCAACRKQFTVRIATIFEESHIPLHKWLQAIHLMVSSKNGISSDQLHSVLEITQKSAWFMAHRIREAMRSDGAMDFSSGGVVVEVDETFYGKRNERREGMRGTDHKIPVLTLVDRTTGKAKKKSLNAQKLKDLIHEVAFAPVGLDGCGWTELYNVMWFFGAQQYARKGGVFSGAVYVRDKHGPRLKNPISGLANWRVTAELSACCTPISQASGVGR